MEENHAYKICFHAVNVIFSQFDTLQIIQSHCSSIELWGYF